MTEKSIMDVTSVSSSEEVDNMDTDPDYWPSDGEEYRSILEVS